MKVDILVEESPLETRIARLEDGRLAALDILRPGEESRIGAVWLGRVRRVVPGMEAAFVEIGEAKAGFLTAAEARARKPDATRETGIGALVHEGESLLVQAIRDPVGEKGVRLTAAIGLAGRDLVHTPLEPGVRVSRKIADEAARKRLSVLIGALGLGGGFIVRTAAAGAPEDAVVAEARALAGRWSELAAAARVRAAPYLALPAPDPVIGRVLEAGGTPDAVVVEGRAAFARLRGTLEVAAPALLDRLSLHGERDSLFESRGVEGAIELALARRVPLPSGGAIVIEPTEALTAIDVDGGAVGAHGDAEAARLRINLEAAEEIARQVRLRDIGGTIVIDFIRLREPASRGTLGQRLEQGFAGDPGGPRIAPLSPFGLIEMTRRRSGPSLDARLSETCSSCEGNGRRPSAAAVAGEAARQMARAIRAGAAGPLRIVAAPDVAQHLAAGRFDRPVSIEADATRARHQCEIFAS